MPQAVVFVANWLAVSGAISVATAVAVGTFALTYGSVVLLVGGLAYSAVKARQARNAARDQYNAAQVDRLVNVTSASVPRELVLGRVRKGGAVIYKASTGAYQADMYLVIALAGHEIDAVESIYLNDQLVTLDASGNVMTAPYATGTTQTERVMAGGPYLDGLVPGSIQPEYETTINGDTRESVLTGYEVYQRTISGSNLKITTHLGGAGQAADPALLAAFPSEWLAANTVQGCAYLVARLSYSETSYPSGIPNITAVVRGARLYDPRTGASAWSENPALMMRQVYAHPKFGKSAITASEDARFVAAANACDTVASYRLIGIAATSRALYRASLVLPFGTAARSAFDDLVQAMGGSWAFAGGELYLKAGVYSAPVMSLGDTDLAVVQRNGASESQQPINISVHRERAQKYNTVKVKIWDQGQDYKQTDLTPLVGAALLARDGVELVQEATFPAVGYAPQALHIAGVMMRDARDPLVVDLPFKLRAYPLELFDTVSLTLSRYGWAAKQFMILARVWTPDGTIQLTLKETGAAITQMDAGFQAQGFASNSNLPKPWNVSSVGALAASSGTAELQIQQDGTVISRLRISWPQHPDAAVTQNGQIEVQYRLSNSTGAWASLVVPGAETQVITSDVADGSYYLVRARAKTTVATGDWNTQIQHQVIGKTEPPSNVAGLTIDGTRLMWERVTDADLAGYKVRYQYGSNLEWGTANAMHEGLITDMPYMPSAVPPGVVTIMLKAVDTTGNESMSVAYVITDLGDSLVANVLESHDFRADAWAGLVSNAAVLAGNLQATQSDPAYRADASDFYQTNTMPFYGINYDGLVWESLGWTPTLAAAGSNMTATWTVAGAAPNIQYRQTGAQQFYGAASSPFYESDALRFYDEVPPWQTWPGSVVADAQEYQFRVATRAGTENGLLSAFVVSIDVPDKTQKVNSVAISPGGTRLGAAAGKFNAIQNVQLTLQGGSTAVMLEIIDKNIALGPLIVAKNAAGTSVSATVDALLQGY